VAEGSGIWVPPGGSADPPREAEASTQPPQPPRVEVTPEQLLEEMRRLKVSDLLVSTLMTVAQLGFAKLDPATRDLEQARLAIEAMRALLPVLEGTVPEETTRDFRSVVSNLQLAYVGAMERASTPSAGGDEPEPGADERQPEQEQEQEAEQEPDAQ
jgi:hypothetical protein